MKSQRETTKKHNTEQSFNKYPRLREQDHKPSRKMAPVKGPNTGWTDNTWLKNLEEVEWQTKTTMEVALDRLTQLHGLLLDKLITLDFYQMEKICDLLVKHYIVTGLMNNNQDILQDKFSECMQLLFTQFHSLCEQKRFQYKTLSSELQFQLYYSGFLLYNLGRLAEFTSCMMSIDDLVYFLKQINGLIDIVIINKNTQQNWFPQEPVKKAINLPENTYNIVSGTGKLIKFASNGGFSEKTVAVLFVEINALLKRLGDFPYNKSNLISRLFIGVYDLTLINDLPDGVLDTAPITSYLENLSSLVYSEMVWNIIYNAGKIADNKKIKGTIDATKFNTGLTELTKDLKISFDHRIKLIAGICHLVPSLDGKLDVKILNVLLKNIPFNDLQAVYKSITSMPEDKLNAPINLLGGNKILPMPLQDDDIESQNSQLLFSKNIIHTFTQFNPSKDFNQFENLYKQLNESNYLSVKTIVLLMYFIHRHQPLFIINNNGEINKPLKKLHDDFIKLVFNQLNFRCDEGRFHVYEKNKKKKAVFAFNIVYGSCSLYQIGNLCQVTPYPFLIRNLKLLLEELVRSIDVIKQDCLAQVNFVWLHVIDMAIFGTGQWIYANANKMILDDHAKAIAKSINELLRIFVSSKHFSFLEIKGVLIGIILLVDKLPIGSINSEKIDELIFKTSKLDLTKMEIVSLIRTVGLLADKKFQVPIRAENVDDLLVKLLQSPGEIPIDATIDLMVGLVNLLPNLQGNLNATLISQLISIKQASDPKFEVVLDYVAKLSDSNKIKNGLNVETLRSLKNKKNQRIEIKLLSVENSSDPKTKAVLHKHAEGYDADQELADLKNEYIAAVPFTHETTVGLFDHYTFKLPKVCDNTLPTPKQTSSKQTSSQPKPLSNEGPKNHPFFTSIIANQNEDTDDFLAGIRAQHNNNLNKNNVNDRKPKEETKPVSTKSTLSNART